jgi:predicted secreted protein
MSVTTAIAIYFLIWWVTLFAVLPFGVRSQAEGGEVVPGSDPGAPATPRVLWKLLWTTVVSGVIFAVLRHDLQNGRQTTVVARPGGSVAPSPSPDG